MKFSVLSLLLVLSVLSILFAFILNWYQSRNQWGVSESCDVGSGVLLRDGRIDDRFLVEIRHSPMYSISIVRQVSIVRDNMKTIDSSFDLGYSGFDALREHRELKGGIFFALGSKEIRNIPLPNQLFQPFNGPNPISQCRKVWAYCVTEGKSQSVFWFENFQPPVRLEVTVDEAKERIRDEIQRFKLAKESNNDEPRRKDETKR